MPQVRTEETNVDASAERLDTFLTSGRIHQLNLVLTLTSDGTALSLEDIGRVLIERNGTQIYNVLGKTLHQIVSEWEGTTEFTAPANGATRALIPIPFWFPEAKTNALNIRSDQELRAEVQFDQSQISTVEGTNNDADAKLFSIRAPQTPEQYEPVLRNSRLSFSGAGVTDQEEINQSGITRVWIRESTGGVIGSQGLQLEQDDVTVVDSVNKEVLNDVANQLNRVESSPDTLVEYNPMVGAGAVGRSQSYVKVSVSSGASGDVTITRLVT